MAAYTDLAVATMMLPFLWCDIAFFTESESLSVLSFPEDWSVIFVHFELFETMVFDHHLCVGLGITVWLILQFVTELILQIMVIYRGVYSWLAKHCAKEAD